MKMDQQQIMNKKFDAIKRIIDADINGEINLPNKTVWHTLTDKELKD
tara:strand:+ start:178 stop:318 length:141 start_codon:yes stop_codon:yes gene_type:complete